MTRNLALAAGLVAAVTIVVTVVALTSNGQSSADAGVQGDANCDSNVDPQDALALLHSISDTPPFPACPGAGDVNCDKDITAADVSGILAHSSGLSPASPQAQDCPAIGDPLPSGTPTQAPSTAPATASPTPALTPTPVVTVPPTGTPTPPPGETCTGPGGGPSLPPDPGGSATPQEDDYGTGPILGQSYLGDAADPVIELALIPGRPDEAIAVGQDGYLYRVSLSRSFAPQPWGDIHSRISYGGEEGLLAVAFSPNFESDCRVYMYYTPGSPDPTVLSRFTATPADLEEASEEILIRVEEFAGNHNGGHIAFDSDDYLYLSLGDGGGGGDPRERGQALNTLLGKVIRIDVSGESGYTVPPGNPFNGQSCDEPPENGPPCEEIFAYGFRNPFRMTIDPVMDDVWLGDVGQGDREEVDRVEIGKNYGWDCREGFIAYDDNDHDVPDLPCTGPFEDPRADYDHGSGQAVTGGVVYRGDDMPELYGYYIYADFYSGHIWAVDTTTGADPIHLAQVAFAPAAFTLLPDGEVAIVSYSDGIYLLTH